VSVFLDANIPTYLVGADHPHRDRARDILDQLILDETRLVTDAEVYQELLRRYAAIERLDAIEPACNALDELVDDVFSIRREDIDAAIPLVLGGAGAPTLYTLPRCAPTG
jgi:predicted nucleic acid-binding protein